MILKGINLWNIIKMSDNIFPKSNCACKETTHVSLRAASYFVNGIVIILTVQWSAVSREFVFKIRRRLVFVECAYTNDVQIRIPILIPHKVWNNLNLAMHR